MKKLLSNCLLIALGLVSFTSIATSTKNGSIGYVVDAEHRIYALNLHTGRLIEVSKKIIGPGGLSNIAINLKSNQLFIGSDRSISGKPYEPLVAVSLEKDDRYKVVKSSNIEPEYMKTDVNKRPNAVFSLHIPPFGDHIFIGDAYNAHLPLITILDVNKLTVTGRTKIPVRSYTEFSPDGQLSAEIWPSHQRSTEDGKVETLPGGVATFNIFTGEILSKRPIVDNKGLHPPWQKLDSSFIYLNPRTKHLLAYDRDSGEILANISLPDMTQCGPAQTYPTLLANPNHAALSMFCGDNTGAVVVIDVLKKKMLHKIQVGPRPTNVVIGNGQQ